MPQNTDLSIQIFQGSGLQRGAIHDGSPSASLCLGRATAGFHPGGVYLTVRPEAPAAISLDSRHQTRDAR